MSPFPPIPKQPGLPPRGSRRSFALVATLAMLAVATILLVLFASTMSLDRSASFSYSQSVKADEIALGGLHVVEGQLVAEMSKDNLPDTGNGAYPNTPVYTNVASTNIGPQANVTNSAILNLVKTSNPNAPFFSGALATSYLQSSGSMTTTSSLNGRTVSLARWNLASFGAFPNNASAPCWIPVTRAGLTNAANIGMGPTGNTLNNPAIGNTNYVIGRIAYAVYDEGGLLDITAAGYPTNAPLNSPTGLQPIKGTLAGADLTQVGITDPTTFIRWRNAATAANASGYLNYVTNFASTNGFQQVYPGDTTFLSRQDLIRAAQNSTAGLTTNALTNLTTFSRELNAPSWGPTINAPASTAFNYANNALSPTRPAPPGPSLPTTQPATQNPNRLVPHVRYPASLPTTGATITGYHSDGTTYTYTVNAGDPLVQHRFPLDRLNWIGPSGPNAAAFGSSVTAAQQAAAIQACFGLKWGTAGAGGGPSNPDSNWTGLPVWQYVGPKGTAEQQSVETLDQVAAEATSREPNFFELLQAGILAGSLGDYAGVEALNASHITPSSPPHPRDAQLYSTLQLLRIGASMISQVQSTVYPINIEYSQAEYVEGASTGKQVALVANGVANLPYLNLFQPVSGLNPVDPYFSTSIKSGDVHTQHYLATYLLFGLWNPHQQNAGTTLTRPNVRLYIQGQMEVGVRWGYNVGFNVPTYLYGYGIALGGSAPPKQSALAAGTTYIDLANTSGAGVNGFLNPGLLTDNDVATHTASTLRMASGFHKTDIATSPSISSSSLVLDPTTAYEVFDIRGFDKYPLTIDIGQPSPAGSSPGDGTGNYPASDCTIGGYAASPNRVIFGFNCGTTPITQATNFQIILKYYDPISKNWIPYDYWNGVNDPANWISGLALWTGAMYAANSTYVPPTQTTPASGEPGMPDPTKPYYFPTLNQDLYSGSNPFGGSAVAHCGLSLTSDPRSIRFGPWVTSNDGKSTGNAAYISGDSLWSGASGPAPGASALATLANRNSSVQTPAFVRYGYGQGAPGYYGGSPMPPYLLPTSTTVPGLFNTEYLPATLCRNVSDGTSSTYPDVDGVQRIADSGLFPPPSGTTTPTVGNPFLYPLANSPSNTAGQRVSDRPVILNRPFNSVGELGYTFRDDPWRSLDFFSSTSADSGLLDLFCVTDSPNQVVTGRVNLNTQNTAVLAALFSNTVADTTGNDTTGSPTLSSPTSMASTLAAYTLLHPLANKDQLVTQFGASLPNSGATAPFANADEENVKASREAYVRSLADVGQTRTWNLMIDLVAQVGRYPSTETNPDHFQVEGERRYWLHVAIDRFTGKIIDQKLEPVAP